MSNPVPFYPPREFEAYAAATEYVYLLEYYKKWYDASDGLLTRMREDVRQMLLDEFDDLEGDILANVMDDVLNDAGFPFERLP